MLAVSNRVQLKPDVNWYVVPRILLEFHCMIVFDALPTSQPYKINK